MGNIPHVTPFLESFAATEIYCRMFENLYRGSRAHKFRALCCPGEYFIFFF